MAMTPASLPSTPTKIAVAPSCAQRVGLGRPARRCRCPGRARNAGAAERDCAAVDRADHALPAGASKSGPASTARAPARRRRATMASASGCSLPRSRLAASRSSSASSNPGAGADGGHRRAALGQGAGLVDHQRVDLSSRSSASAFLISTPACAPRPTPTMIDIGVARPSAQGQAMISTDTAATRRVGEARLGPDQRPGGEGDAARRR